jgi:hypothetical protein
VQRVQVEREVGRCRVETTREVGEQRASGPRPGVLVAHEGVVGPHITEFADPISPVVQVRDLVARARHPADEVMDVLVLSDGGQGDRGGTRFEQPGDVVFTNRPAADPMPLFA